MNFPDNLKYTKEHEWVLIEGNTGTIGVTEYAQSELGDVVFIDIDPNVSAITKRQSFGTIEAVKTVSDIYAPCNGTVIEINKLLADNPETVNTDPYGQGWIVKIKITDLNDLNDLLDSKAYKQLIGQ